MTSSNTPRTSLKMGDAAVPAVKDVEDHALIVRGSAAYRQLCTAMVMAGLATFALLHCVQPLLPLFTQEFGVGAAEASLAVSLATGPLAIALIPAGILSDRVGRRPLMIASLFVSAAVTILSAMLPGWGPLLLMRMIVGIALSGIPAVAMAYIAEEVEPAAIGPAMGLYVAGTAIGGMTGRLGSSVIAEVLGWRAGLAIIGITTLLAAALFWRAAPPSRHFETHRHSLSSMLTGARYLFGDRALPLLFLEAFLLMGIFMSIYNYAAFRLVAPPYGLSRAPSVRFSCSISLDRSLPRSWGG